MYQGKCLKGVVCCTVRVLVLSILMPEGFENLIICTEGMKISVPYNSACNLYVYLGYKHVP